MVESWIIYGLLASLFFGINAIVYKVAAVNSNMNMFLSIVFYGIGILLTFIVIYLVKFSPSPVSFKWTGLMILAGVIWALAFLMVAIAISHGADLAKLSPIYNTNTLITVILGIVLLREIPSAAASLRVILGAVLIIIGSVLVAVK